MIRSAICALMATACAWTPLPAHADEGGEDYARATCFLGGAGAVAMDVAKPSFGHHGETYGWQARAGCRGAVAGGELHYEWLPALDFGRTKKQEAWSLTLDGKLHVLGLIGLIPGAEGLHGVRLQPFASVGFGILSTKVFDRDWDFLLRLGGGLDLHVTRHIAINLNGAYVRPTSDALCGRVSSCSNEDLDYASFGAGLIFQF